jgi:hypothetical protein
MPEIASKINLIIHKNESMKEEIFVMNRVINYFLTSLLGCNSTLSG